MQFIQSHEMCAAAAVQVSGIGLQGGWAIRGQTGLKQSLHVACNSFRATKCVQLLLYRFPE